MSGRAVGAHWQRTPNLSEDFLANVGTKVLLGIDPIHWADATRKLRVEETQLRAIHSAANLPSANQA